MDLQDTLTALRHLAQKDPAVRDRLLASREAADAAEVFRRATNGGGENSPVLDGEDDYYDLFMSELEALRYAEDASHR